MASEKLALVLDGVKRFASNDKFLPGKIAMGMADYLLSIERGDPRFAGLLAEYRAVDDATLGAPAGSPRYRLVLKCVKLDTSVAPQLSLSPSKASALPPMT